MALKNAPNHCNSLLKSTKIHETIIFVSRLKHVLSETIIFPYSKRLFVWTDSGLEFRERLGEESQTPKVALATENCFAPLICRVVRAVRWRWALGLDSRWGTPLRSVSSPNLRQNAKQAIFALAITSAFHLSCSNIIASKREGIVQGVS